MHMGCIHTQGCWRIETEAQRLFKYLQMRANAQL